MAARLSSTLLRTQTDRRLTALAADGSEPAFEALVERYRKPLQGYCRRMLLPAEAAEDAVQQAFLGTWQALGRGTEIADIRAWLYRSVHNAAINALRRSGYDHEELHDLLRGSDAPEEDLERRTAVRQALAGLAALPELQREALMRTAVEGQTHEEVARALGLSDGAVRGLVYRARATLRTAAGALVPGPLVAWAAGASREGGPLAERVAELVAGGGSAGAGALLMKGGATVLTAGALAGGVAVVEERPATDRADRPQAARRADAAGPASAAGAKATSADRDVALLRRPDTGVRALAGDDGDDRSGRSRRSGERSGPSDASGRRPGERSGPGSDDDERDEDERDEDSGSGSSGSGSGDDDHVDDDGSGSGAGDDHVDDDSSAASTEGGSDDLLTESVETDSPESPDDDEESRSSGSGSDDVVEPYSESRSDDDDFEIDD